MKYLLYVLTIILLACNKAETPPVPVEEPPPIEEQETLNYLALGDSYTIGTSVNYEENYPSQLYTRLTMDGFEKGALTIIAQNGWTTGELQAAINRETPATDYDLVSLLIGVNNQFRGNSQMVYENEFEELLQQAINFAGADKDKVFVLSIPDYAFTPFGQSRDTDAISQGIDEFNEINKKITKTYEVQYFNITPISRKGIEQAELVASDGLHPSGEQYKIWVDSIYRTVKEDILSGK